MKRTSLKVLLPAAFLLSVLAILGSYASLVISDMHRALSAQAGQSLVATSHRAAERVEKWFAQTERNLTTAATSQHARDSLRQFAVMVKAMGPEAKAYLQQVYVTGNPFKGEDRDNFHNPGDRTAYSSTHEKMHDFYRSMRRENGYYDVFLFDTEGTLVYSAIKEPDLGHNALTGELANTNLGSAFRRSWDAPDPVVVFEDFVPYPFSNGLPAGFLATQIRDADGKKMGVMAIQIPTNILSEVVMDKATEGQDHAISLIGSDGFFRMEDGEHSQNERPAPTPQVIAAVAGETGLMEATETVSGQSVMAAFKPVKAFNSGWSVLVELDRGEVLAPIWQETRRTLIAIVVMAGIAVLVGAALGRWIAQPLAQLTQATSAMQKREDTIIGYQTRSDEVGALARSLEVFRQDQIRADANRIEMLFKGQAFNTTSSAMMIADAKGRIIYVNAAIVQLFRTHLAEMQTSFPALDPDQLVGSNIALFHTNNAHVMDMLESPDNTQIETDIQIGDQVFALSVSSVDGEDGGRLGYVVVWENVRDQRRKAAIIDAVNSAQAILEIGLDGSILTMNETALNIYKFKKSDIIGHHVGRLFKSGMAEANDVLKRVIEKGNLTEAHHRIAGDGTDRFIICNLNTIRNRQGDVQRIVAICTDQTNETITRTAAEAALHAASANQHRVVESLRDALGALAQGDLTKRIETPFSTEYEGLRANFNQAADSLSETLAHVADVAASLRAGANNIASAAADLSRRTESQAATLEETAAALDTLTSNVRSATEGTLQAGAKVTSAHTEARNNGGVVRQAIEAMSAIESSSHQISQIISVIDDIAFQTNLLALNAGVEAARAGDAGRGFAVVAAEVRALAQRSSEAAKEIKALISTSEAQVHSGADLVGQSGRAVQAIVADVAQINSIVQAISQASQDQANGLAEINAGVSVLDKVTQQNAVMVEESTAASSLLKQEADELATLLSAFRLRKAGAGRTSAYAA